MNGSTHPFTCNTCQVAFKSSELQRTHMQSDWHRYNLKRRVASLPPLSSEVFNEKVLANRASAAATAARAAFEKNCEACKKTFYSENAFVNHLSSQKHKSNVAKFGIPGRTDDDQKSVMSSTFSLGETAERASTVAALDSDVEDEFQGVIEGMNSASLKGRSEPVSRRPTRPHHSANGGEARPDHPLSPSTTSNSSRIRKRDPLKECLFCSHYDSETLDQCLDHMIKIHGLFIPEPNYVADMEGLVKYLNSKVNEEHQCLYCGRLKWSEDGIKTHMRDTNHCKIAYETEDAQLELGQFYDFRSTYSDEEEEWDTDDDNDDTSETGAAPGGGVKLGVKRTPKTEGDEDADGEGWETDSTASSVPTEELGRVYVDEKRDEVRRRLDNSKHHSSASSQRHRGTDGFHSHAHQHTPNAVYYDDVEMHLPSGRTAGHRSLNKIWRQNLRSHPSPAEREQQLLTAGSDEEDDKRNVRPSDTARERERGRGRDLIVRNEALGVIGLDDASKRQLRTKEQKEQKRAAREQRKFQARVSEKANQQKHFRDPLLQ